MLSPAVGKNISQVGDKISRKLIKITHNTADYSKGENISKIVLCNKYMEFPYSKYFVAYF